MELYVHYELAAVGFMTAMLIALFRQRQLNLYRNQIFQGLVILILVATGLDIARGVLYQVVSGPFFRVRQMVEIGYLVIHITCGLWEGLYILSLAHHLDVAFRYGWKLLIPYLAGIIVCITSPWTKLVFYFNNQGEFQEGSLYQVMYLIVLLYVTASVILAASSMRRVKRNEKIWIYGVPICIMFSVFLKLVFFRDTSIVYFLNCFFVFACFLFLQSSDYYLDEVTGFFKMHGFEEVLRERMAYGMPSSYLIIRIIHYNAMQEMYEDTRLTKIKQKMAQIMMQECKGKTFYHIASSTFAVISSSEEESKEIYRILQEKLPKVWEIEGEEIIHEYSYYTVDTPAGCDNVTELLQRIAYARSDHEGHHKPGELIRLTHETVELAVEKQRVADLVEEAILDNSIEIYFQPIYSLKKERVTSVEVLARLKDRDKKFINPEFFIHVAEESRTIIPLGEQIYRKACIFASQNHIFDMGIDDININLSPIQCCYGGLAEDLIRIAGEYDIPMSRMHLEITESAIMNKDEIMNTLEELCASGAKIALDDFGTGYSSMTSIVSLPVDYVKIDKSLVWSYGRGENTYLNQLVPMIQAEGKKIIAEGIETVEHINIFRRLKGEFLQGYHYSKPLPEKEFIQYLRKANHVPV